MANGVNATVDEEGMSMDEEDSRVDGGWQSQKNLIRETVVAGSPVLNGRQDASQSRSGVFEKDPRHW